MPETKKYKLLGADGSFYESETPGEFGGNSKLKIYGRLDCPSALSTIKRFPGSYEKVRVFFADEKRRWQPGIGPAVGACIRNTSSIRQILRVTRCCLGCDTASHALLCTLQITIVKRLTRLRRPKWSMPTSVVIGGL